MKQHIDCRLPSGVKDLLTRLRANVTTLRLWQRSMPFAGAHFHGLPPTRRIAAGAQVDSACARPLAVKPMRTQAENGRAATAATR